MHFTILLLAVQYDKENGWSGIIVDTIKAKKGIVEVSDEAKKFFEVTKEWDFSLAKKNLGDNKQKTEEWIKQLDLSDESLKTFLRDWDGSGDIQEAFTARLQANTKDLTLFKRATKVGGTAMRTLDAAIGSMAATWAIGEVLSAVFTGIDSLLNQASNISEKAEGFASTMDAFNSSVKEGSSQIDDLANKYEKLSEGVDNSGNNVSLTAEQYSEYKDTVSKLSDIMPDHISLLNAQGEKIGFVGGKLKDANKEYREYLKNQATSLLNDKDENGNSYKDTLDDYDIQ